MALSACEVWSDGIKIAFISKNYKNCPADGGFVPRPLKSTAAENYASKPTSVIRLSYISLLKKSPKLGNRTFYLLVYLYL